MALKPDEFLKILGPEVGKRVVPRHLQQLNELSGRYYERINQEADTDDPLVKSLTDVFSKTPELSAYEGTNLRRLNGSHSSRWHYFACWVLAQVRLGRHVEDVIEQLDRFVHSVPIQASQVLVLWGFHPAQSFELYKGIWLVPLSSLPRSGLMDQLTGIKDTPHTGGSSFPSPRPNAALKFDFDFTPGTLEAAPHYVVPDRCEEMRNVARCLCLATKSAVHEIASYYYCDVTTPFIGGVTGWGGQAVEQIYHKQFAPTAYDEDDMRTVVNEYMALGQDVRNKLRVPIDRLNIALKRTTNEDVALELGISLDALLAPESVSVTNQIRSHGAYLIEKKSPGSGALEGKRLAQLYGLRSRVAHGATLPAQQKFAGQSLATTDFLQQGMLLSIKLIRTIIEIGGGSGWDAGGSPWSAAAQKLNRLYLWIKKRLV